MPCGVPLERYPIVPSATPTRRPDLGADLARVLAACQASGDLYGGARACSQAFDRAVRAHRGGSGVDLQASTARALRRDVTPDQVSAIWNRTGTAAGAELVLAASQAGVDLEVLRSALIGIESTHHIGLVQHQANKLARSYGDYSAEDLFGWGWIGLRAALRSYDPERFAFSTYACTRIIGAMRDGVRAEQPIPKRLGAEMRKVQATRDRFVEEMLRAPTLDELQALSGITRDRAALLDRCRPAASLDELCSGEDGSWTPSVLEDAARVEDLAQRRARSDAVEAALSTLEDDDATVVRLLILEGLSTSEVRERTGATPRQIRQRRARALATLAPLLEDWSDDF